MPTLQKKISFAVILNPTLVVNCIKARMNGSGRMFTTHAPIHYGTTCISAYVTAEQYFEQGQIV